jgi:flagellar export protein FliJ
MAGFTFRLASLLRVRESLRDEKRLALAQALRADAILENQLHAIQAELALLRADARRAVAGGPLNLDRLLDRQRYELLLRAEETGVQRQRGLLAEEIERRRGALVEADREVRVLEKVRDVQRWRHQQQEQRRELAQLDEIALRPYQTEESS